MLCLHKTGICYLSKEKEKKTAQTSIFDKLMSPETYEENSNEDLLQGQGVMEKGKEPAFCILVPYLVSRLKENQLGDQNIIKSDKFLKFSIPSMNKIDRGIIIRKKIELGMII